MKRKSSTQGGSESESPCKITKYDLAEDIAEIKGFLKTIIRNQKTMQESLQKGYLNSFAVPAQMNSEYTFNNTPSVLPFYTVNKAHKAIQHIYFRHYRTSDHLGPWITANFDVSSLTNFWMTELSSIRRFFRTLKCNFGKRLKAEWSEDLPDLSIDERESVKRFLNGKNAAQFGDSPMKKLSDESKLHEIWGTTLISEGMKIVTYLLLAQSNLKLVFEERGENSVLSSFNQITKDEPIPAELQQYLQIKSDQIKTIFGQNFPSQNLAQSVPGNAPIIPHFQNHFTMPNMQPPPPGGLNLAGLCGVLGPGSAPTNSSSDSQNNNNNNVQPLQQLPHDFSLHQFGNRSVSQL